MGAEQKMNYKEITLKILKEDVEQAQRMADGFALMAREAKERLIKYEVEFEKSILGVE